jgi:hypothetical protein
LKRNSGYGSTIERALSISSIRRELELVSFRLVVGKR